MLMEGMFLSPICFQSLGLGFFFSLKVFKDFLKLKTGFKNERQEKRTRKQMNTSFIYKIYIRK